MAKIFELCVIIKVVKVVEDLTKPETIDKIVQAALDSFGRIDVLVNNAGTVLCDDIFTINEEDFCKLMKCNFMQVLLLTKACAPHLVDQKGVVVNVSSVYGSTSRPGCLSYSISKAALDQLTRCVSLGTNFSYYKIRNVRFLKKCIFQSWLPKEFE